MTRRWLASGVVVATDAAWQRICRVGRVGRVASESAAGSGAVVVVVGVACGGTRRAVVSGGSAGGCGRAVVKSGSSADGGDTASERWLGCCRRRAVTR